jgi:hypothetical protein
MRFRRPARRRRDSLRACPCCASRLVCPLEWHPSDDGHWWIALRCGDCDHRWEAVVDDRRAARYDAELDGDRAVMQMALFRLERERMKVEVEAFAHALSRDLIEPADFAA